MQAAKLSYSCAFGKLLNTDLNQNWIFTRLILHKHTAWWGEKPQTKDTAQRDGYKRTFKEIWRTKKIVCQPYAERTPQQVEKRKNTHLRDSLSPVDHVVGVKVCQPL